MAIIIVGVKYVYIGILLCKDLWSAFYGLLCVAICVFGIVCGFCALISILNI